MLTRLAAINYNSEASRRLLGCQQLTCVVVLNLQGSSAGPKIDLSGLRSLRYLDASDCGLTTIRLPINLRVLKVANNR